MSDEPVLDKGAPSDEPPTGGPGVVERIARLLHEQPYAVLCTQGGGQPYGSLVAFAATGDLGSVVFATTVATRKYRLLCECDHVAIVFDSRSTSSAGMMEIEALTATGRAAPVAAGPEFDRLAAGLVHRHPQLADFVRSPTTALFRVDILRYLHVGRFQEVCQWCPPAR